MSSSSWKFFLLLIICCLVVQGFFAMLEMACVSFNKVRLQYYVSKQNKRALWLSYLFHHPALLFGTTLIGVNTALIDRFGMRPSILRFLGLKPRLGASVANHHRLDFCRDCADVCRRRYAEHVAMLGIPILFFFSIHSASGHLGIGLALSGDQPFDRQAGRCRSLSFPRRAAECHRREGRDDHLRASKREFNTVVANIFTLKNKTAKDLMQPLTHVPLIPSFCTVGEMRDIVERQT